MLTAAQPFSRISSRLFFKDIFLGGYDCIHVVTLNMNNVHFYYTARSHFVKRIS